MKPICIFLGFLMFTYVKAKYHPSKMCTIEGEYKKKDVEDCSFQFPEIKQKICNVFARNVCLERTSEFLNDVTDYEIQSEAKFSVEVLPYTAVINLTFPTGKDIVIEESEPLSAINITFAIPYGDVSGLAFFVKDESVNINFCRLLDFNSHPKSLVYRINLFYDCLYYLTERRIQNVTMTFISLPSHKSLSYYVFIPPHLSHNSLCKWKSLIMVFQKALSMGTVQIKFSTAPVQFNVSSYVIELVNAYSGEKTEQVAHREDHHVRGMVEVEFSSVEDGFYFVSVKPFNLKDSNCSFSSTETFKVVAPFNIALDVVKEAAEKRMSRRSKRKKKKIQLPDGETKNSVEDGSLEQMEEEESEDVDEPKKPQTFVEKIKGIFIKRPPIDFSDDESNQLSNSLENCSL